MDGDRAETGVGRGIKMRMKEIRPWKRMGTHQMRMA